MNRSQAVWPDPNKPMGQSASNWASPSNSFFIYFLLLLKYKNNILNPESLCLFRIFDLAEMSLADLSHGSLSPTVDVYGPQSAIVSISS